MKKGPLGPPCNRFVIDSVDQGATDSMAIIVPWIGIESTLSLVQTRGSHTTAREPASTAVTIDNLVRAEFGKSEK